MKKAVIGSLILSILHSILFYGQDLGVSVLLFMVASVFLLMAFFHSPIRCKEPYNLALQAQLID